MHLRFTCIGENTINHLRFTSIAIGENTINHFINKYMNCHVFILLQLSYQNGDRKIYFQLPKVLLFSILYQGPGRS
jgi:hypothetical protein